MAASFIEVAEEKLPEKCGETSDDSGGEFETSDSRIFFQRLEQSDRIGSETSYILMKEKSGRRQKFTVDAYEKVIWKLKIF